MLSSPSIRRRPRHSLAHDSSAYLDAADHLMTITILMEQHSNHQFFHQFLGREMEARSRSDLKDLEDRLLQHQAKAEERQAKAEERQEERQVKAEERQAKAEERLKFDQIKAEERLTEARKGFKADFKESFGKGQSALAIKIVGYVSTVVIAVVGMAEYLLYYKVGVFPKEKGSKI
jgi:hypothetical protein